MTQGLRAQLAAATLLAALVFTAGCRSNPQKAVDQAKAQAASTQTPQQVQYVDNNGDTVTTTVQPPVAGQPQQVATTITSPPPGPKPHSTNPVVTPLGVAPVLHLRPVRPPMMRMASPNLALHRLLLTAPPPSQEFLHPITSRFRLALSSLSASMSASTSNTLYLANTSPARSSNPL